MTGSTEGSAGSTITTESESFGRRWKNERRRRAPREVPDWAAGGSTKGKSADLERSVLGDGELAAEAAVVKRIQAEPTTAAGLVRGADAGRGSSRIRPRGAEQRSGWRSQPGNPERGGGAGPGLWAQRCVGSRARVVTRASPRRRPRRGGCSTRVLSLGARCWRTLETMR